MNNNKEGQPTQKDRTRTITLKRNDLTVNEVNPDKDEKKNIVTYSEAKKTIEDGHCIHCYAFKKACWGPEITNISNKPASLFGRIFNNEQSSSNITFAPLSRTVSKEEANCLSSIQS